MCPVLPLHRWSGTLLLSALNRIVGMCFCSPVQCVQVIQLSCRVTGATESQFVLRNKKRAHVSELGARIFSRHAG